MSRMLFFYPEYHFFLFEIIKLLARIHMDFKKQKSSFLPLFDHQSGFSTRIHIPMFWVMLVFTSVAAGNPTNSNHGVSRYVDPFIGVNGGGNVVPGPSLPFGVVKLSPDCDFDNSNSGYVSGQPASGFSHVHVSGTGGGPKYGNILVMPTTGDIDIENHQSLLANEEADAGFYRATLSNYGIEASLTVTRKTGFHRYTFPRTEHANLFVDAGSFLGQHYFYEPERQFLVGSQIEIVNDHTIRGYSRVRGGWNEGDAYTVYFYAIVDRPALTWGTWKEKQMTPQSLSEYDSGQPVGAWLRFDTTENPILQLKVGISYISSEKARHNLEIENPGWNFDLVREDARQEWERVLGTIDIETDDVALKRAFYTAIYHSMLMPVEKSGENPQWLSSEPYYDDFYAVWDTFRSNSPLLTLLLPSRQIDIVRSMIDIAKHDGYLPDARSGDCNGRTQGGSNAEIVIADAFAKGLGGIDYSEALKFMLRDAELPPGGDERKEGRGGLFDYQYLGYISIKWERSGSRTLEYAYNDWAIGKIAQSLGFQDLAEKYYEQSNNWRNLWRPIEDHGAKGFIMPRNPNGTWVEKVRAYRDGEIKTVPFTVFTAGSWNDVFYESHSWEYSLYVPHDVRGLIQACGGNASFVSRLNTLFEEGFYNVGNEPGFLAPMLYIYAGRPDLTAKTVSSIRNRYFHDGRDGIPGNDDSGAMSSLYAFHSLGFFPNAGQDVYLIGSPAFERSVLHLENGKDFEIIAHNLSDTSIYVQSAQLNGEALDRAWFRHGEIIEGATLELFMGAEPTDWGTKVLPPSKSDPSLQN